MREIGGERDRDAERKKKRRKKNRKKQTRIRQTDRQTKTEADSTPAEMLLTVYEHKDEDNALRTDISEHLQQACGKTPFSINVINQILTVQLNVSPNELFNCTVYRQ